MKRIARFEKVSLTRFILDSNGVEGETEYDTVKLPKRATSGSAGYDFYSPIDFTLQPNETIKIATGIRAYMEDGWVLKIYPRSGLGFKYRLGLNNTVGIIDQDYYFSDNEGHIQIKITNASLEGKTLNIKKGEAFAQGIFLEYGITYDDDSQEKRNGGFGSTNKA